MKLPLAPQARTAATRALEPGTALHVPKYLESAYWWAYVHPRAVQTFEREWLVNAILWGNYARLRDQALEALGPAPLEGHTLQVACVYGNLTERLRERLAADARLDVVDILPIQLSNLRRKLGARPGVLASDARVQLLHGNSAALPLADASVERVLLFFLLHEQPAAVRSATLAEALRVVKPGGRVVIVDYHRPARWHPLRWLMAAIFRHLEPFAEGLWREEIEAMLPAGPPRPARAVKRTRFGGLYQVLVWTR